VLYDLTTLYFETPKEDALRKVGMSKERRVDPQVTVGLLCDPGGFPLAVHPFEGVYEDAGGDFVPFGTDEGLGPAVRVGTAARRTGTRGDGGRPDREKPGLPSTKTLTGQTSMPPQSPVGAGFTLLRPTGRIDEQARQQTLEALDLLIEYYDSPQELVVQRRDLESWTQ